MAAQRSAKKFAAFVVNFFIPFPSGTKISGEYTGGTSGEKARGIASFFVRRQNFGFNPEPGPRFRRTAIVWRAGLGEPAPARPVYGGAVRDGAASEVGGGGGLLVVRKEG